MECSVTELEVRQDATPVVSAGDLTKLGQWAQDARQAHAVAISLASTAFVSKEFRDAPQLVTAAILTGQEIGLEPMASLRSIDIISGTPAMRAHALRGLVQSRGHDVWVEESTETRAIVKGQRKGSQHVQESRWTIDRATKLGLTGRDQWRKQPQAMLIARATAEVCRLVASDVLLGMPYAVEELEQDEDVKPARKAQRKPVKRAEPEAPALEPVMPEPTVEAKKPAEPAFEEDSPLRPDDPDLTAHLEES